MPKKLLWIDGIGAALAGVAMLTLSVWLAKWYHLPRELLIFMGWVNLAYACYSLPLAWRRRRPKAMIHLLVTGNLFWALVCLRWAVIHWDTAGILGMVHLIGEGAYVGGLGLVEWRWRNQLLSAEG